MRARLRAVRVPLVNVAMLALLFLLWNVNDTPRRAAGIGFAFGLGLFGAGASWVYIALETFGGMPAPVAVIATAGFVGILALYSRVRGLARRSRAALRRPRAT